MEVESGRGCGRESGRGMWKRKVEKVSGKRGKVEVKNGSGRRSKGEPGRK